MKLFYEIYQINRRDNGRSVELDEGYLNERRSRQEMQNR